VTVLDWIAIVLAVVLAVAVPVLWTYEGDMNNTLRDPHDDEPDAE
jgi:hypothetical protein